LLTVAGAKAEAIVQGGTMQLKMSRELPNQANNFGTLSLPLVGSSPRMRIVRALIAKLAGNNCTVLITG